MITDLQWQAFGLVQQLGFTLKQAAIKMSLSPDQVARLLKSLKREQPDLFKIYNERDNMRQQFSHNTDKLMYQYNPEKDENNTKRAF